MKKIPIIACLVACTSAYALSFNIGPIKVTSHKADRVVNEIKKAGDTVKSIAKGTGKWVNTELITTVTGKRALVIKPYIAVTHDGQSIKVGPDEAHIKIAGLSMSTHHLTKRLAEIGCIVGTEGAAVMICATEAAKDIFYKEAGEPGIPAEAVGGDIPESPATIENQNSNFCRAEPDYSSCFARTKRPVGSLCGCFNDQGDLLAGTIEPNTKSASNGMTEVQIVPPKPGNPGFDFRQ
ncbi:MAG: hypothetical protein KF778_13715 [Rhodocyclaceae bacterium]|nr:hypothetical protein [Rhodocyclaceae bacterium]MBX3669454.1 hypothetical protein [Rhodocyclaceae bacterium]